MLNRIEELFQNRKKNILSIYFTAGYPGLKDTTVVLQELQKAGADMIEIGIPFSDPLADGPVIQHSSEVALKNGMSVETLFGQLEKAQSLSLQLPVLLMSYLNPILQFGIETFAIRARECGIAGVIIPDLPLQEYLNDYQAIFEKYGLLTIFLITPQTTEERIRLIDTHSKGFIYMVASAGTTGVKPGITSDQENYFNRIKNMKLKNPTMIGFGISDRQTFAKACEYANGAIIGSSFIKAISRDGSEINRDKNLKANIHDFIKSIR